MRRAVILVLVALVLLACGSVAVPTAPQVAQTLSAAGAVNFHDYGLYVGGIIEFRYQVRQVFGIAQAGGEEGEFFICETKENCDQIFTYYASMQESFGAVDVYQSPSGTVVVQLPGRLLPEQAAKFEQAVMTLP
jgi:hypothetical protein